MQGRSFGFGLAASGSPRRTLLNTPQQAAARAKRQQATAVQGVGRVPTLQRARRPRYAAFFLQIPRRFPDLVLPAQPVQRKQTTITAEIPSPARVFRGRTIIVQIKTVQTTGRRLIGKNAGRTGMTTPCRVYCRGLGHISGKGANRNGKWTYGSAFSNR